MALCPTGVMSFETDELQIWEKCYLYSSELLHKKLQATWFNHFIEEDQWIPRRLLREVRSLVI